MSAYFCDSSALVKRYVTEPGTDWVTSTIDPKIDGLVFIARITLVEVASAIFRKERNGHISAEDTIASIIRLESDCDGEFFNVEITEHLIQKAVKLTKTYGLRGYDAVQLAAALQTQEMRKELSLSALLFLSADNELNAAAVNEGLRVENPNEHK